MSKEGVIVRPDGNEQWLVLGAASMDPLTRRVRGGDGEAEVSPIAARFLALLAAERGRTIDRPTFVSELWAGNHLVGDKALNRVASEARRALNAVTGGAPVLETVHGRGYRLITSASTPEVGKSSAQSRRGWLIFFAAILTFLLVVASLSWLIMLATGLAWSLIEN